jgi:thioesterase domain-containing protein
VDLFVASHSSAQRLIDGWKILLGNQLRIRPITADIPAQQIAVAASHFRATSDTRPAARRLPSCRAVTLQEGAPGRIPVFVVPGAGASVTSFMALAAVLRSEIPIHGLQPRGLDGEHVPHSSVEAAAISYLRAVKEAQPTGPYRFVGHSFGGWVAFEMALQMQQAGEIVEPIVVIDSDAPSRQDLSKPYVTRVDALVKLIAVLEEASDAQMRLSRQELERLQQEAQLAGLLAEMKRIGALPPRSKLAVVQNLVRVFEANLNTSYVPRAHFNGTALLMQASERSRSDIEEGFDAHATRLAWAELAATFEAVELPGKHMTVLQPPYVAAIARRMLRLWKEVPGEE